MGEVFTTFVDIVYNIVSFLLSLPLFESSSVLGSLSFGQFLIIVSIMSIVLGFLLRRLVLNRFSVSSGVPRISDD